MTEFPTLNPSVIRIKDNHAITTSLIIADIFGKQHKNIIQKINNLECSAEFTELNFQLSEYKDPTGRRLTQYDITKDGFIFLVMGFTGKKAAHMKEAYISAFNKMEAEITERRIYNQNDPTLQQPLQATRILMTLQNGIIVNSQVMPNDCLAISPKEIPALIRSGELIATRELPAILQAASETILKRSII